MGSFAFTCAVSGLPIEYGDPVRYLLLAENPYTDNIRCYLHDLFWVRTFPLKGTYNDYGSVENVEQEEFKRLWLDSFKYDLIEKGVGDNSCHDVKVRVDQTFEELLEAVWEGRVEIRQGDDDLLMPDMFQDLDPKFDDPELNEVFRRPKRRSKPSEVIEGVPTMRDVEALIGDDFLVDEEGYGRIRVRVDAFGNRHAEKLEEAAAKLGAYATMITRGTGYYAHVAELLVRPLPNVSDYRYREPSKGKTVRVYQSMIREDVWQALLSVELNHFPGTFETYKPRGAVDDPVPFTFGVAGMRRMAEKQGWDSSLLDTFKAQMLEYDYVALVLSQVRYQWRPSYGNGPQFGEWQTHAQLLELLAEIAENKAQIEEE